MSFWDDLTGKTTINANNAAADQTRKYLGQGQAAQTGHITDASTKALGYYDPFAQTGVKANALYGDAIGVNGRPAQQAAIDTYGQSDPFRSFNEWNANRAMQRHWSANGGFNSGAAAMAAARANLERGSQDWQSTLNRWQGMQGQGVGIAGQQAGIAQNTGNALAGIDNNYYTGLANTEMGLASANNQARMGGVNNLMKIGGAVASAVGTAATGVPMNFGGGSTDQGTAANGGWTTTTKPSNNWSNWFSFGS